MVARLEGRANGAPVAEADPLAMHVAIAPHPLLDAGVFVTEFSRALGAEASPDWLLDLLAPTTPAPLSAGEETRRAVRDLLRHGGYKPTGRGKPASEYLLRAAGEAALRPINLAADACNAVSLHSGLPISVVDLDRIVEPLGIAIAAAGQSYVFNPAGQEIDVSGLLCLHDAAGPCANAVKDAQRSKTDAATRRTLSVIWGTRALPGRMAAALAWYREILARAGARTAEL